MTKYTGLWLIVCAAVTSVRSLMFLQNIVHGHLLFLNHTSDLQTIFQNAHVGHTVAQHYSLKILNLLIEYHLHFSSK